MMSYSELIINLLDPTEDLRPDEGIYHLKFKVQIVGKAPPVDSELDILKLTGLLENWDNRLDLTWENVMEVGDLLGKALLPKPLDEILLQHLPRTGSEDGLRLRLILTYPFTNYPWEYLLFNDTGGETTANHFLGLRSNISIVRHQEKRRPAGKLAPASAPTKLVIALASPKLFQPVLNLSKERAVIEAAVARYPMRIQAVYSEPATATDLQEKLKDAYLFHFAGHAMLDTEASELFGKLEGRGKLILDNGKGFNAEMPFEQLSHLLASANTRVALLGGCETARRDDRFVWSSLAANLLNAGLFAVIGMQYKIGNDSATAFSGEFYNALLAGLPVDQAVTNGRLAIANANNVRDWGVPALYLSDITDGLVFKEFSGDPALEGVRQKIRIKVNQTVKVLNGTLVGIKVKNVSGGDYEVNEKVDEVGPGATMTGFEAENLGGGKIDVEMDIKEVKKGGEVAGVRLDSIGGEESEVNETPGENPSRSAPISHAKPPTTDVNMDISEMKDGSVTGIKEGMNIDHVDKITVNVTNPIEKTTPSIKPEPTIEEKIRLDVAVAEKVVINQVFVLAVAIRQSNSPPLKEEALPKVFTADGEVFRSEPEEVIRYRVCVNAPDCKIFGQSEYVFRLKPNTDSEPFYFQLAATRSGDIPIIVTAYQDLDGTTVANKFVIINASVEALP